MPRLSPALIRQATSENPLLTKLLRVCRHLPSARNELRWLQEHARDTINAKRYASHTSAALPHGDVGVEIPKEWDQLGSQRTKLNHAIVEDSDLPTKSRKKGRDIRRHHRSKIRRVKGPFLRKYQAYASLIRYEYQHLEQNLGSFKIRYHNTPSSEQVEAMLANVKQPNTSKATQSISKPGNARSDASSSNTMKIKSLERAFTRLGKENNGEASTSESRFQKTVAENVEQRSRGVPLQYIIGDQPFGKLDILCRPGVLIPRPETEMYTTKVAHLLVSALNATDLSDWPTSRGRKKFRILDLCSGSGCIALLLHSILKPVHPDMPRLPPGLDLEILGCDIKPAAVKLARRNLQLNTRQKHLHWDAPDDVLFGGMDVLDLARKADRGETPGHEIRRILNVQAAEVPAGDLSQHDIHAPWDMVIANPPYIAPEDYALGGKTEQSVRDYEPKEALVPVVPGRFLSSAIVVADLFYQPLIRIARAVDAKLLVMEVGGSAQAVRVGKQLLLNKGSRVSSRPGNEPLASSREARARLEAWRDDEAVRVLPIESPAAFEEAFEQGTDAEVSDRAIVAWSGHFADWRHRNPPDSSAI